MSNTDSPCIGICSTTYGDKVCRGCKRHYDEVISWNAFIDDEKLSILQRIDAATTKIVADFLSVTSTEKLKQALKQWGVRHREDDKPETWALQLLKFADRKITAPEEVGLKIKEDFQHLSMHELCNTVDKALYQHSCKIQKDDYDAN